MKAATKQELDNYRELGMPVGDFLHAALTNNFVAAVCLADADNLRDIKEIAQYIYNDMPSGCWRTPEKINAWQAAGGLSGIALDSEHLSR